MENLEKMIKYLDGEVIGEERQKLEQEIANDSTAKETIDCINETGKIIADNELVDFIAKMNQVDAEYKQSLLVKKPANNFRFLNKKLLMAASIVLLLSIFTVINFIIPPSNNALYDKFYTKYDACVVTRSGDNTTDEITIAIQLYDKGKYSEALEKFNKIIKQDNKNTAAHFFAGVSYMEIKAYDKAIQSLNTVIAQNDTAFLEHAEWYLALCYLKSNHANQAKTLIKQIASSESYYRAMATDLSKKVK